MTLRETFAPVYGMEKNGKVKQWTACIHSDKIKSWAIMTFGQLGGKQQEVIREYTVGKHIGKKNETTPFQQCVLETRKKWLDKQEKEGYSLEIPTTTSIVHKIYPMLAKVYDPKHVHYPCFVQPKLDGIRCVIYLQKGHVMFQSRTGTFFESIPHIEKELQVFFQCYPSIVLDGELFTFQIPFEELAGLVKKKKRLPHDSSQLGRIEYHVYDIVDESLTFEQRHELVSRYLKYDSFSSILYVDTQLIGSEKEFRETFMTYVSHGYEGIMLRSKQGKYRCQYRSVDLQKYKEFQEDEYPIIGFKEGDGRDKGCVIWICQTKDGREFSVRPRGSIESRKEWFQYGSRYIGKSLTVIFQELSELQVPRFPVGKAIRDGY